MFVELTTYNWSWIEYSFLIPNILLIAWPRGWSLSLKNTRAIVVLLNTFKTTDLEHSDIAGFISPAQTSPLSWRLYVTSILRSPGDLKLNMSKTKLTIFYLLPAIPPTKTIAAMNHTHTWLPSSVSWLRICLIWSWHLPLPHSPYLVITNRAIIFHIIKYVYTPPLHYITSD